MEIVEQSNIQASLQADLSAGSIIVSGPIEFVNEYREVFIDFITQFKERPYLPSKSISDHSSVELSQVESTSPSVVVTANESKKDVYINEGLVHVDEEGRVSILKRTIPGSSSAKKSINIALILAYFHEENKITNNDIIPVCQKFACYDSKNFASVFNKRSDLFIKRGKLKSRTWDVTLTIPGVKEAETLLDSMRTPNGH